MEKDKGLPAKFHCHWCEKEVEGFLIKDTTDYKKGENEKEYECTGTCQWRITRIRTKI